MNQIITIIDLLEWGSEDAQGVEMFRGQAVSEWPLLPRISRYAGITKDGYDAIAHIEEHLIEDFEKYSVPYFDLRKLRYVEKLVHAQHHGLPTRLLDWSTNPLKALFYAVEDASYNRSDAAVYGFATTGCWNATKHVNLDELLVTFFPDFIYPRVASQEGCFTSFPLEMKSGFDIELLSKDAYPQDVGSFSVAIVPSDVKLQLRIQLARLGVTRRTLFPGLDGVAKWIKSDHAQYRV